MTTIAKVRCLQIPGPAEIEPPEERQLQMLDAHPELARRGPGAASGRHTGTYVEVLCDDGASGLFGPIFAETAPINLGKLASHVVGQDPLAYERIWDVLYRQDRHARKGYEMMAISAVDCALWDAVRPYVKEGSSRRRCEVGIAPPHGSKPSEVRRWEAPSKQRKRRTIRRSRTR